MPKLENKDLGITHVPRKGGLTPQAASILAALVECRDLMCRIRYATVDYDSCDSWTDEIIEAADAIDSAIAGFVEDNLHRWVWSKEHDAEMIAIDWGVGSHAID